MKKWIFVVGFLTVGVLFFTSGTLVGYSVCEKKTQETSVKKSARKPSVVMDKIVKPIINYQVNQRSMSLQGKMRVPSVPAITTARKYQNMTAVAG